MRFLVLVDNALHAVRHGGRIEDMEVSIPKIMLTYLRQSNPQDPKTPNRVPDDELMAAARQRSGDFEQAPLLASAHGGGLGLEGEDPQPPRPLQARPARRAWASS